MYYCSIYTTHIVMGVERLIENGKSVLAVADCI